MICIQKRSFQLLVAVFIVIHSSPICAQENRVYQLKSSLDAPILMGGFGLLYTGFVLSRTVEPLSEKEIGLLDKEDINKFDRFATNNYFEKSGTASDLVRLGGWLFPLGVVMSDKRMRSDLFTFSVMALEVYTVTSGITTMTKSITQRVRPFVYNPEVALEKKTTTSAKKSFFSGHTSATSAFSFFLAKVINDYSNNGTIKTLAWGSAGVLSTTAAVLRVRAGKHFPTDVIMGLVVGAAVGYGIPHLHLSEKESRLSIYLSPFGVGLNYNLRSD